MRREMIVITAAKGLYQDRFNFCFTARLHIMFYHFLILIYMICRNFYFVLYHSLCSASLGNFPKCAPDQFHLIDGSLVHGTSDLTAYRHMIRHNISRRSAQNRSKIYGGRLINPSIFQLAQRLRRRCDGMDSFLRAKTCMGAFPFYFDSKRNDRRRTKRRRPDFPA